MIKLLIWIKKGYLAFLFLQDYQSISPLTDNISRDVSHN